MRMSQTFGETLREPPAEADTPGYALLLRAGYVRPLASGLFSYLPLGLRSLHKIGAILREELDGVGGQEIAMPLIQPAALWTESGRLEHSGEELVRFRDRAGRSWVMGPSHEEVAVDLVRSNVKSYRQLPIVLYQIAKTYRDEIRPRAGLIRAREFTLLASYSFDRDEEGRAIARRAHRAAFLRVLERVGLSGVVAASGEPGADETVCEELMLPLPVGDDGVALCRDCGYAANRRIARFAKPEPAVEPARALEKVATPETETIAALAAYLNVPTERTAKVVLFEADVPEAPGHTETHDAVVMALVRGDMEVSEAKLRAVSGARYLGPADEATIRSTGAEPGYASPVGLAAEPLIVVVDDLAARSANLISGANEAGYHYRNANFARDYRADRVADIAAVFPGAACPECGSPLVVEPCIEVGSLHGFREEYTARLGATFQGEDGNARTPAVGSYGVGLGRILGCIAETHRDDAGLRLPPGVAPFDLHLVAVTGGDAELTAQADAVYSRAGEVGIDVLYDDRDATPGVKFNDADLIGIPIRATLGARSMQAGGLELKRRASSEKQVVPLPDAIEMIERFMHA
jgi:prolyl-tRNA synthetase